MSDLIDRFALPQAQSGSPLDQYWVSEDANAASATLLRRQNPDRAAQASKIARDLGLPADTVERNLDAFQTQADVRRARSIMERYPAIGAWAANPKHAAIAGDDLEALEKNARFWQGAVSGSIRATPETKPTLGNILSGLGTAFIEGGRQMRSGIRSIASDLFPDLLPRTARNVPRLGDFRQQNAVRDYEQSAGRVDDTTPSFKSWWARDLYSGTSSLVQMAPAIAAGVTTGGVAPVLAIAGAQQGLPAYPKYRARGGTAKEAALGATLEGGAEAAGEALPMGFLVSKLGKIGLRPFLAGFFGRELPSELATTIAQNATDTAIANPDKTWGEFFAELPEDLRTTAVATLVMSGAAGGLNDAARRLNRREEEQLAAANGAEAIDQGMAAATDSKVRARDPGAFSSLLQGLTQDSPVEKLFVPAETLATYFQSNDIDYRANEFWDAYADQIDQGLATGGDVVIPTSEAAAHLAGTPAWEAIKSDVRTSPGGMSLSEAEAFEASKADELEKMGAEMAAQIEADRAALEPRQRIVESVSDKLMQAGYTPDAALQNAELVASRYATRANRLGQELTGAEADKIDIRQILPEGLAPAVAADQLDLVIAAMKGGKEAKPKRGASLLEFIAKSGGIEDRGGDIRAMGGAEWHKGRPGRRKLIREAMAAQSAMFGTKHANTPDALALAAWEAGYFPEFTEQPDVNTLLDAIGDELRGNPRYAESGESATVDVRQAADELRALLGQRGINPDTADARAIRDEVRKYQAEAERGGFLGQPRTALTVEHTVSGALEPPEESASSRAGVGMSTLRFANYPELSSQLADDLLAALSGIEGIKVKFGASNQSASRYVNIDLLDEEGDPEGDGFKVRFSDHADRHGADATIRFDRVVDDIQDDIGEHEATEISRDDYDGLLRDALEAVQNWLDTERPGTRTLSQSASPADSAAFKKWFGNSKVVDENGEPLIVYHGTPSKKGIDQFRPERIGGANDSGFYGEGFYFTPSRELAQDYIPERGGAVEAVYLSLQNPFVWDLSTPEAQRDTIAAVRAVWPEAGENPVSTTGIVRARQDDRSRAFTAALRAAGHDGVMVMTKDIPAGWRGTAAEGEAAYDALPAIPHEIVAFDPTQIKSVNNIGPFDPSDPRILHQTYGDGPRGQISFANGRAVVELFEARDLSTFVHEMGHNWLEELREDAEAGSEQARTDWEAVQDWFKANGHPLKDDTIPTDAHEMWARGFERFMMEGKSPSTALRRVFDAFRSWLLHIYRVVDNLRAPITPEIREVMERLIATDEEIAQARQREFLRAAFADAEEADMSEAEFAEYQKATGEAKDAAFDALLVKTMQSIRQARTKAWKEEEAGVRADVTARINRRPEFKALHLLRTGKFLDNPDAEPIRAKLDTPWLVQTYGEDVLGLLPKGVPPIFSHERSTDADSLAELIGFRTGDEMVRTLIGLEQRQSELRDEGDKRSVKQRLIDEETAAEMRDRHGDPLNDGSIEEEALAAVMNEKQGELLATELRVLQRKRGEDRPPTPYSLAKEWAQRTIREGVVRDVASPAAVQRYARAAAKAGKEAEAAILKRDLDEAYRQKQRQMLNAALVSEARKAGEAIDAAVSRLGKIAKRATIKSVEQSYLDQAHALLEQVEFRDRSQASIDRQESFAAWAAARQAEGHDVAVPDSFAESLGTTHWSRLTVEKLLGLDETVKQIVHLGRLKQKLIDGREGREFNEVLDEAVANIERLPPKPPEGLADPSWTDRFKSNVANADAALLKMETVFDWLDGDAKGVFNRVVFKPIADAQSREQDMFKDYAGRLDEALASLGKDTLRRLQDKVIIPELMDRETNDVVVVNRKQLISMALNMGNEGNAQRLADGHGWNRDAILSVLNRELSVEEWQYVQSVWDIIDGLWPEIEAMEKRLNGVAPDKVEARPLETAAGTLRGGYFPVVYDTARDYRAEQQSGESSDLFEAKYTRATTTASATKERLEKVSRPILLDLGVITRHVGEVIHDITHREAVMNADKFLSHPRIKKAVDQTLGRGVRQQFRPWLKFVANQWAIERAGNEGVGAFIGKLRSNATVVGLGFRVTTVMMQLAGYSNSFEVVGARWVGPAVAQAFNPATAAKTWAFVMERSGEVRHRMDTIERDINEGIKRLAGKSNPLTEAKRFAYHGIGYTDRLVVVPTWLGAYNKALAGGATEEDAIYAGDKAVRQSQGAGAAKDMAAVQRGTGKWGEAMKLFTMFYSYMSAVYQRQRTLGRDIRSAGARDVPGLMARAFWLVVVPPILSELMAGRGPDDDEDWGWWAFSRMLFQTVGAIPIVRDLAPVVYNKLAGKPTFGYSLSPLQSAGASVERVASDLHKFWNGDETKRATRNALEAAGYWTGLVPGQLATASQFLVDVGYGAQDPQTVGDWWEGLTTGKIKDD